MDEPTATLTPGETQRLFALMAQLKAEGVTLVYISHKLDEVERVTDEVIVMRDGRFVTRQPTQSLTRHDMANLMVGRELSDLFPAKEPAPQATPVLRVRGFTVPGWAQDVELRSAARRNPRLRRPRGRGSHRAVRRPARPARRRAAKWRWPASRCACAIRARRPTKASPT